MEESRNSIQRENTLKESLLRVVSEAWRFKKGFERLLSLVELKEKRKNLSKLIWFERELTEALTQSGFKLQNFEGQPYTAGIPATPINIEDFDEELELYVSQTVEPTVLDEDGRVVRAGAITVERVIEE